MVRQWTDDPFSLKATSALEKIQAILPAQLQGEFQQITTYSMPSDALLPWSISFSDLRECIRATRQSLHHFRLDRIQSMVLSDEYFEEEEEKNLAAYKAQYDQCEGIG
ncbi:hypothetical protein HC752_05000 [Vibrio sp. S9_S30]|nr:hypothetical protein [Vibrio sp. S9_S30]